MNIANLTFKKTKYSMDAWKLQEVITSLKIIPSGIAPLKKKTPEN